MAINIRDYPQQRILKLTLAEDGSECYINLFGITHCETSDEGRLTKLFSNNRDEPTIVTESIEDILNRILNWTNQLRREELIRLIR